MQKTRRTSPTGRRACLAAALTAAAGTVLALGSGGIVRVAADAHSTKSAPAMSGRAEGDHEAQPPATTSMSTYKATKAVTDSAITTEVKTKLLLTIMDLKSTAGIHVMTKDGIVNVSGTVPSKQQHDIALETIRSVDGVRSIHDRRKVSSRRRRTGERGRMRPNGSSGGEIWLEILSRGPCIHTRFGVG